MPTSVANSAASSRRWSHRLNPAELEGLSKEEFASYRAWYCAVNSETSRLLHCAAHEARRERPVTPDDLYLQGDYDRVGLRFAYEWGE